MPFNKCNRKSQSRKIPNRRCTGHQGYYLHVRQVATAPQWYLVQAPQNKTSTQNISIENISHT